MSRSLVEKRLFFIMLRLKRMSAFCPGSSNLPRVPRPPLSAGRLLMTVQVVCVSSLIAVPSAAKAGKIGELT